MRPPSSCGWSPHHVPHVSPETASCARKPAAAAREPARPSRRRAPRRRGVLYERVRGGVGLAHHPAGRPLECVRKRRRVRNLRRGAHRHRGVRTPLGSLRRAVELFSHGFDGLGAAERAYDVTRKYQYLELGLVRLRSLQDAVFEILHQICAANGLFLLTLKNLLVVL